MTQGDVRLRYAPDLLTVETGAEESYSFDRSGCVVRAAWDGHTYRWGLDGGCLEKVRQPFGTQRERYLLGAEQGMARADAAYRQAAQLLAKVQLHDNSWQCVEQAICTQGAAIVRARTARFPTVYSPVGILPPDQYGALVLQLTEGCRYNRCAFCTFYKNRPYRIKTAQQFTDHVQAVLNLVGEAISRRRTVFLGDANALGLPFTDLCTAFDVVQHYLPISQQSGGIEGIYTFMDVFGRNPKTRAEFAALAERGLRRVYIGAESGSQQVLHVLQKPDHIESLYQAVQAIKAGGVGVGLVFLLGAGGNRLAEMHTEATAQLLANLPLDSHDIVYFSELVAEPHSAYAHWERQEGVQPLSPAAMQEQERNMRHGLPSVAQGGPRVTRYDVREFVYY